MAKNINTIRPFLHRYMHPTTKIRSGELEVHLEAHLWQIEMGNVGRSTGSLLETCESEWL